MAHYLKNDTGSDGTWAGQTICAGIYYFTTAIDMERFANNSVTIAAIESGDLIISSTDGVSGELSTSQGIQYLEDNLFIRY